MARKMNFFEDFYEAGLELAERERERLYTAMLDYYFAGKEPSLSGGAAAVFRAVRDRIDLSKVRASAGSDGGSKPKQTRSKPKANAMQTESIGQANSKQTESKREAKNDFAPGVREGERDREEEHTESVCSSGRAHAPLRGPDPLGEPFAGPSYAPPSPEEVSAFLAAQTAEPIDARRFCDWYSDHGWPKNDWRGSAMSWSREGACRSAGRKPGRSEEVRADDRAVADELAQFRAV